MLSIIVPSSLMIALSTLNIVWVLICYSSSCWLLTLNLTLVSLQIGVGSTNFMSVLEKLNYGAVYIKLDGSVPYEKCSVKIPVFVTSNLDWGSLMVSIAEITSKNMIDLFYKVSFLTSNIVVMSVLELLIAM